MGPAAHVQQRCRPGRLAGRDPRRLLRHGAFTTPCRRRHGGCHCPSRSTGSGYAATASTACLSSRSSTRCTTSVGRSSRTWGAALGHRRPRRPLGAHQHVADPDRRGSCPPPEAAIWTRRSRCCSTNPTPPPTPSAICSTCTPGWPISPTDRTTFATCSPSATTTRPERRPRAAGILAQRRDGHRRRRDGTSPPGRSGVHRRCRRALPHGERGDLPRLVSLRPPLPASSATGTATGTRTPTATSVATGAMAIAPELSATGLHVLVVPNDEAGVMDRETRALLGPA